MRGHEPLIAMRRNERRAPSMIFINDHSKPFDFTRNSDRDLPDTICVHGDVIQLLDMRFLVGLRVSIGSASEIRAKALFEACKAAGAVVVAAVHIKEDAPAWKQDGWVEIWHKSLEVSHG